MRRKPAVAGTFYPADAAILGREVRACLGEARGAKPAVAVLAPHAGYIYSGPCASTDCKSGSHMRVATAEQVSEDVRAIGNGQNPEGDWWKH